MSVRSRDSMPTRPSLLARLKDPQDQDSWNEFFALYHRRVYHFALQRGMNAQEAEDVVQETFACLTKNMGKFQYDSSRGKFRNWLLHLAQWRVGDEYKRRGRLPQNALADGDQTGTAALERIADPVPAKELEEKIDAEWRQAVLDAALERVKSKVTAKQFQAYDLSANKGWPAPKVALTLGTSAASVHLNKHRVSKLIKKEIAALNKDKI